MMEENFEGKHREFISLRRPNKMKNGEFLAFFFYKFAKLGGGRLLESAPKCEIGPKLGGGRLLEHERLIEELR